MELCLHFLFNLKKSILSGRSYFSQLLPTQNHYLLLRGIKKSPIQKQLVYQLRKSILLSFIIFVWHLHPVRCMFTPRGRCVQQNLLPRECAQDCSLNIQSFWQFMLYFPLFILIFLWPRPIPYGCQHN